MKTMNVLLLVVGVALVSAIATWYFCPDKPSSKGNETVAAEVILDEPSVNDTDKPKKAYEDTIEFEVVGPEDKESLAITTQTSGSNCNNPKKGCFKVRRGKTGIITFKFTAPDVWKLAKFEICKGTVENDSDKKGLDCDLGLWEKLDFFVSPDSRGSDILLTNSDGSIDLTALSDEDSTTNPREFYLLDQNAIKNQYFYSITACTDVNDPTTCISTDPAIDNKGRN